MVYGEPLAGASKAGHNLVRNHQNAVLVADFAHALDVAVRRHKDSIRAGNRLQDKSRDRLWSFELDHFFDVSQSLLDRIPTPFDAMIWIENTDDARNAGFGGPSSRIAGEGDTSSCSAMVRTVTRQDLVASREKACDFDGILIRFRTSIGKKKGIDVPGCDFREFGTQPCSRFRGHEWIGIRQRGGLLVDRFDDPRIAMSYVYTHQLAVEINEALTLGSPEVDTFGFRYRQGVDFRLCRPLIQSVLL